MVMIRFWRSLTKKDRVQSDRYEITLFFAIFILVFGRFFTDPDFYGSDPDLYGSDPDSGKKVGSGKKPGSETLEKSTFC